MKKRIWLPFLLLACYGMSTAQSRFPAIDKSPLDISYFPENYPYLRIQDKVTEPLVARVMYSRPQKSGRVLFGELIEYGKVWRLGANEATEIEFFIPVTIGKVKIKKGRYSLFAIPDSLQWTIILNRETDTWGSFRYDPKKDVARVQVPVEDAGEPQENLGMYFWKKEGVLNLVIGWDKVRVSVPISY